MDGILTKLTPCDHRLSVHGLAVEVQCEVPALNWPIHRALGEFATPDWPDGFVPVPGQVQPYDESVVMRHLSPAAVAVASADDLMEIYEHEERFWLVDDRWGICEINLLKGNWQSWIVPQPTISPDAVVESAILWPLAQLLRPRGVTLVPAASVSREGFGALIISPFTIEPELTALAAAGWRVIGQRWTALREEDERISLLRMPGRVERVAGPRFRGTGEHAVDWVDLTEEYPEALSHHGFCDAVIVAEPGRRGSASSKAVKGAGVAALLKRAWPIFDLHVPSRQTYMPLRLAAQCAVVEAQLSRRASDFVNMLDRVRLSKPMVAPRGKVQPQIMPLRQPKQIPA